MAGLPVVPGSTIGVIANPMSGRDIRRLVAQASVFPNAEKANMVLRIVATAGVLGVDRVPVSTDDFGIASGVLRAARKRTESACARWPELVFCERDPITATAADTKYFVRRMRSEGVSVIVILGGDGTVRAAAGELGDTPVLPLSTGTNNAFPQVWEATVAGMAAALVACGRVDVRTATRRAKALVVESGASSELALVDVCVSATSRVGARALWTADTLRELYCAFAEPHAIGLSSIAGQLMPTTRNAPTGVAMRFTAGGPAQHSVLAPIAPGRLATVNIASVASLPVGQQRASVVRAGTVAVDGEREFEFGPDSPVTVTLSARGPRVLDVPSVLDSAAHQGVLRLDSPNGGAPVPESATGVTSWRIPAGGIQQ